MVARLSEQALLAAAGPASFDRGAAYQDRVRLIDSRRPQPATR
jgi:hypothetical protein